MLTVVKGWKTLLVNGASIAALIFGWERIGELMDPRWAALGLAVANAVLRFFTTTPVAQKTALWFALALCAVGASACAVDPAVIEALAKDQATVCAKVTTIYGTINFARSNITSGDVKCDGLEVHSPGQTIVPVTVTPVQPAP